MNNLAEMTNPGGDAWEYSGDTWEHRAEGRGGCVIIQIQHGDNDTSTERDDMSAGIVMSEQMMYRWWG